MEVITCAIEFQLRKHGNYGRATTVEEAVNRFASDTIYPRKPRGTTVGGSAMTLAQSIAQAKQEYEVAMLAGETIRAAVLKAQIVALIKREVRGGR